MNRLFRFAMALGLLSLPLAALWATTVIKMTEEQMTQSSDLIAIGKAASIQSVWLQGELMTLVEMRLNQVLKGRSDSTITLVVPGGIDADHNPPIARVYPGAVRFSEGQDVFLFLMRIPNQEIESDGGGRLAYRGDKRRSYFSIAGFSQGAYSILEGPAGGMVVARDLRGLRLASPDQPLETGGQHMMPLDSFKNRIEGFLKSRP